MVSFPLPLPIPAVLEADAVKNMAFALMDMAAAEADGNVIVAKLTDAQDQLTMAIAGVKQYLAAKKCGQQNLMDSAVSEVVEHTSMCHTLVEAALSELTHKQDFGT